MESLKSIRQSPWIKPTFRFLKLSVSSRVGPIQLRRTMTPESALGEFSKAIEIRNLHLRVKRTVKKKVAERDEYWGQSASNS